MSDFYISPSGSDTNPGTIEAPFKTFAAAESKSPTAGSGQIRYLFDANGVHGPMYVKKDGTPDAPRVFDVYNGTYGKINPTTVTTAINCQYRKNLVFQNLNIKQKERKDGFVLHGCENISIRDCVIEECGYGLNIGKQNAPSRNILLERVVIRNCWDKFGDRSQGLYATDVHGLKILNCIVSRNGWRAGEPQGILVRENHNIYLSETNTGVEIRDSYLGEACSHGVQMRCGGIISGCLFYFNPIHAFGQNNHSIFENNILDGSAVCGHGVATIVDVHRGWGYDAEAAINIVKDNLFINGGDSKVTHSHALKLDKIVRSIQPDGGSQFINNRIFNWQVAHFVNTTTRMIEDIDNKWNFIPKVQSRIPYLGDSDKTNWPDIPAIRQKIMEDYTPVAVTEIVSDNIKTLQTEATKSIQTAQANMQNELQLIQKDLDAKLQGLLDTIKKYGG